MECEKVDSFDGECQLDECYICLVDDEVKLFESLTGQIRTGKRGHDDLDKAIEQLELCCNSGRKDPTVLISSEGWIRSFSIVAMELLR